jgi:hypothetical protein
MGPMTTGDPDLRPKPTSPSGFRAPISRSGGRAIRAVIWLPGLVVALGAAVATAHGLYETAVAARVPTEIAWLYPIITDGLALVAYAATARLIGSAARYAWAVVVLAAGLSGLAQASYLSSETALPVSAGLRAGVGAWPALAAAITAHLLYLLASHADAGTTRTAPRHSDEHRRSTADVQPVQPVFNRPVTVQPDHVAAAAAGSASDHAEIGLNGSDGDRPVPGDDPGEQLNGSGSAGADAPARDRARAAAARHAARHALPTVTELERLAQVSRGTAAAALKALREQPIPLPLVPDNPNRNTQS